jgi:hypothetical protein
MNSERTCETKKVRSHKNYPKYLEYNIIIHVGIMYKKKQIAAMSKNITSTTSVGQNRRYHGSINVSSSFQEPYKNPNPQKIELGWADSFTIRQFCSVLRRSYCLRSSMINNSRMKNREIILQARARDKSSISML